MMDEPKYKRVLLKISGEALAGDKHFGLDFQVMGQVADVIRRVRRAMGVQVGVVVGGGNFWRGLKDGERPHRARPRRPHGHARHRDQLPWPLADVLEQKGVDVRVQTAHRDPGRGRALHPRPAPSATSRRAAWSSSAAAPAAPSSPPTPPPCCAPPRSARTSSCSPRTSTASTPADPAKDDPAAVKYDDHHL